MLPGSAVPPYVHFPPPRMHATTATAAHATATSAKYFKATDRELYIWLKYLSVT